MDRQQSFPLWVSHTSIRDFLSCPRAYFLRHIYKDPRTGKKINIINPALALGNAVHDALESISDLPAAERFKTSLVDNFEKEWIKYEGDKGGFRDANEEASFKQRGLGMLQRVTDHPGPLVNKAVKLRSGDELPPRYKLSVDENILLCGKVDWLEYFPEDDSVHIIDFKTGTHEEDDDSLQLPIYALLVMNCQSRRIRKISYWYLDKYNEPTEMVLPDFAEAHERVLHAAMQVKKLRQERKFVCARNGCFACKPLEKIVKGEATYIRTSGYQDIYAI